MERMFGRPIVTQEQMRARIRELGRQISADFAGKDLVLVGVLKGGLCLLRRFGASDPNSGTGRLPCSDELWIAGQDLREGQAGH